MTPQASRSILPEFLRAPGARRRVAVVTAVFAVAGGLYGILAPKWYRSTITVVPAGSPKSGVSSLLGAQLGGLASALDGGGGADAARIAAVLQSTAVTDAMIDKFELRARYGRKDRESTRIALWGHCEVKTLPKPNLVQLSCEDRDPTFVRDMLAFFADYGNQVFRKVSTGSASEEARFLERRVAELRRQAEDTATRMRDFQEKHQIVDLESQARAVVSSVAVLKNQRIAKQMELDYTRAFASSDEAGARQLQSQLSVVDEQLRDLEEPRAASGDGRSREGAGRSSGSGMFPAALAVPRIRAEYEKLFRDRKVSEATLVFALERLEAARANEARDVSTFQVLDPPTVPERKSRPRGSESLLNGALLGFAVACAFEWWRNRRIPPAS